MAYGHAENLARIAAGVPAAAADTPASDARPTPQIDPPGPTSETSDARPTAPPWSRLYDREDVRRTLAERDIAGLYRVLNDAGVPQRQIAELTGQSQSEVSEIVKGRRVIAYDVLVRIADGLGVPRGLMGLSYGEPGAYGGQVTVANPSEGVDEDMLRRQAIELGAGLALGAPAAKLAQLLERLELPDPPPVPVPTGLSYVHVTKVQDLTRRLGEDHRAYGPDPEMCSFTAAWATRLLDVPGTEPVKRALKVAVAELHLQAGWAGTDAGLYDQALHHCGRALKLGTEAGDAYCQAVALNRAGLATVEHGDPNEGLKLLQVGTVTALNIPQDEPRAVVVGGSGKAAVQAIALVDSATALADLDEPEKAKAELARSRELWQPNPTDTHGDLDRPAAVLELEQGKLDAAEPFAAASVRRWEGVSRNGRAASAVVLATVYIRAGEPRGLKLAHSAITAAAKLTSFRVRQRLVPLYTALDSRPGSDHRELARIARQVAAMRA